MLFEDIWWMWASLAARLAFLLDRPRGVSLVLDDGSPIPCSCAFSHIEPGGSVIWRATPTGGAKVPAGRVEEIAFDYLPRGAGLDVSAELSGFSCPDCGIESFNPNDIREGYCGRCHGWTGKAR